MTIADAPSLFSKACEIATLALNPDESITSIDYSTFVRNTPTHMRYSINVHTSGGDRTLLINKHIAT